MLFFLFNKFTFSLIFVVFFVFYLLASGALWHHFSKHDLARREIAIAKTLFVFVSAVLFLMAFLGILYL